MHGCSNPKRQSKAGAMPVRSLPCCAHREQLGGHVRTLPEMLFHTNLVELTHVASGTTLSFNAGDALRGWVAEALPPLQVKVAAVSESRQGGWAGWQQAAGGGAPSST